jgi:hypothetical protein
MDWFPDELIDRLKKRRAKRALEWLLIILIHVHLFRMKRFLDLDNTPVGADVDREQPGGTPPP